jgi:hypothetical protein
MARSSKADGLRDYNEVADRVAQFNEDYEAGRIVTSIVAHQVNVDEVVDRKRNDRSYRQPLASGYVVVRAEVYRGAEDTLPAGTGHSWMLVPGTTQYTRDSELENAETSAIGRALATLGYYAKGQFASTQEIRAKKGNEDGDGNAAASSGNSSTRRSSRSASGGSQPAPDVVGRSGSLTAKQEKFLEARLKEAGMTGDRRKAALLFIVGKRSRTELTGDDLDKILAFLDDKDSEENAETLESIMFVSADKTEVAG